MQFVTARGSAGMAVVLSASMLVLGGQWPRVAEAATHGPDLGVTILGADADARGVLTPDQTATVTVGVHNLRGDAEAHNTTLTVVVPGALAVKRARPMPDRTEPDNEGTRLIWTLGTVPAGAFPRLFALDLQASPDLKGNSELRIRASVATSDVDPNDRNNRVTYMLVVGTAAAQLNVTSNLDSVPFTVDRAVQFSIDVTNVGTIAAAACDLTMTLPPKASVESSGPTSAATSANAVTWRLGDIGPSQARTVTVVLRLDPSLRTAAYGFAGTRGLLEFNFAASTTTKQLDPGGGRLKVARYPEPAGSNLKVSLNVDGTDTLGELPVGKDVTYEILYGNYGNEAARQVAVTLSLPEGLSLVSAVPRPAHSNKSDKFPGGVISWDLGDLAVGRSDSIKSTVHVASVGNEEKFVAATIAAGAGHDIGWSDKAAYAWYGPPLVHEASGSGDVGTSRWIVLLGIVAVLASAIFVLRALRHRGVAG